MDDWEGNDMRKKTLIRLACLLLMLSAMALPVYGDTGPKPSVNVTIEGLEGRACWATLLSARSSTGPHSSLWRESERGQWVKNQHILPRYTQLDPEYPAWAAFAEYEEERRDWFFLQEVWDASDGAFAWTYYPPDQFQIALWFPGENAVVLSQTCEQYAFDSYYHLDLSGAELEPGGAVRLPTAARSYDYTKELVSLAVRVVLTVGAELGVAWLFHLRSREQMALILVVNLLTQGALNLGLNWYAYKNGTMFLFLPYLLMELGVVLAEGGAYLGLMPGGKGRGKQLAAYALAANGLSLALGWVLALFVPGIF